MLTKSWKRTSAFLSKVKVAAGLFLLAVPMFLGATTSHSLAGSIFDDDWVNPSAPVKTNPRPAPSVAPEPALPKPAIPEPAPANPQAAPKPNVQPQPVPEVVPPQPPAAPLHQRLPIPAKADQQRSRKLFKEIFAKELQDATPQGRRALAEKLIQEARKASDAPCDQFVLLAGAIQSAKLGSQLSLCVDAADTMAATFDVDPLWVKVDSALRMSLQTTPPATSVENCQRGLELVAELIAAEDYETASKLLSQLRTASAADPSVRDDVQRRMKDLEAAKKMAEAIGPALAKLKTAPDDPTANLAVGENLCFVRNNWSEGLPHLAKGNDPVLKGLATRDLANSTAPAEITALGNDWWDAAAKRNGQIKNAMRGRGYKWLSAALTQVKGLQKTAIEKRLSEAPFVGTPVGLIKEIQTNHGSVLQVAFAPDGHSAVSSGHDATISLWNLLTGEEVRQYLGHTGEPHKLGVPGSGHVFISSGSSDQTIRLWNLDSGNEVNKLAFQSYAGPVAISPDGTTALFSVKVAGSIIISTTTFKSVAIDHSEWLHAAAWSPDGKFFATGGTKHTVHIYDARSMKQVASLQQPDDVYAIAFTPDDRKVVTGNQGHQARVIDIQSRQILNEFDAGGANSIAIAPDGRFALAPSGEPTLFFWDLATGKRSYRFEGQQTAVISVAISRDGKLALSGDKDGSIRLWRLPTTP